MTNPSGMRRHYPPYDVPPNLPLSPEVPPRPGHGRLYLGIAYVRDEDGGNYYLGSWEDEFPEPDSSGATLGVATISGTRDEVLAWGYAQPAATKLILDPATDSLVD